MQEKSIEDIRFPIGRFHLKENYTRKDVYQWIDEIADFPEKLSAEISRLTDFQLNTKYRQGGWTIRQVVHHLADSHMNSYIRFKLALTEDEPHIKPYLEDKWGEFEDAKYEPVDASLSILKGVHYRWAHLLRRLKPEQLSRRFFHPESKTYSNLEKTIAVYSWHCAHHLRHITDLKERMQW